MPWYEFPNPPDLFSLFVMAMLLFGVAVGVQAPPPGINPAPAIHCHEGRDLNYPTYPCPGPSPDFGRGSGGA
jgi:hypothetical protein